VGDTHAAFAAGEVVKSRQSCLWPSADTVMGILRVARYSRGSAVTSDAQRSREKPICHFRCRWAYLGLNGLTHISGLLEKFAGRKGGEGIPLLVSTAAGGVGYGGRRARLAKIKGVATIGVSYAGDRGKVGQCVEHFTVDRAIDYKTPNKRPDRSRWQSAVQMGSDAFVRTTRSGAVSMMGRPFRPDHLRCANSIVRYLLREVGFHGLKEPRPERNILLVQAGDFMAGLSRPDFAGAKIEEGMAAMGGLGSSGEDVFISGGRPDGGLRRHQHSIVNSSMRARIEESSSSGL